MLTDITLGQYYPGNSFLHRMDPRAKIICTMIFITAIFIAESFWSYLLVTAFLLMTISVSGVPIKLIVKAIKPLWFILVFTFIIHLFTTPGTTLFYAGIIHITREGIIRGTYMTLRLVYLIAFSSLLTYTTSPIVLTDGIEALLTPWKRFGVPAHELAMMMSIALRFIPTLLEETDRWCRCLFPHSVVPMNWLPPWKPDVTGVVKAGQRCTSFNIRGGIALDLRPLWRLLHY